MVYLDDGLGAAADKNKAKFASLQVHADLLKSGFLPNEAKRVWGAHLGYYLARSRSQHFHF